MKKDFNGWNKLKQVIEGDSSVGSYPQQIWWCSLGVNIGAEVDGKGNYFERPVLVMKVYNRETLVVLPLTKKPKDDIFHYKINFEGEDGWVKLTQTRVISSKRLCRKMGVLDWAVFWEVKSAWKDCLFKNRPFGAVFSDPVS